MTTKAKISRAQAEAALAAVRDRFKPYLEPFEIDGHVYSAAYPEPKLAEDWNDREGWAIVWEEGPDDWAYTVTSGGPSEEERTLVAQAAAEFGADLKPAETPPVRFPKTVYAEPYFSFVLALYPA